MRGSGGGRAMGAEVSFISSSETRGLRNNKQCDKGCIWKALEVNQALSQCSHPPPWQPRLGAGYSWVGTLVAWLPAALPGPITVSGRERALARVCSMTRFGNSRACFSGNKREAWPS